MKKVLAGATRQADSVPGAKWVPLALWLASMVLPVAEGYQGFKVAFLLAIFSFFPAFWLLVFPFMLLMLPNLLILAGTILMFKCKYRGAAVCGGIASALSLAAGAICSSCGLGPGYLVWLASFFALLWLAVASASKARA